MRHRRHAKRFSRTPSHRKAMMRNMAASLLRADFNTEDPHPGPGRIITTPEKAKECRKLVERLITLAKKGGLANFRRTLALLDNKEMAHKLFNDIAPRYTDRQGGYTRILHLVDTRLGDNARQCIFELVEEEVRKRKRRPGKSQKRTRAGGVGEKAEPAAEAPAETPEEEATAGGATAEGTEKNEDT